MNREDIIRMAREVGMTLSGIGWTTGDDPNFLYPECVYTKNLERFAALVAAVEREACARVCDFEVARLTAIDEPRPALAVGICAVNIRARGQE